MAGLLDLLSSRGNALLDMPYGAADARSRNDIAAPGILGRMLSGMDNPAPTYADTPLGDPLAGQPEPNYDWRKATGDRYLAQRVMRGLSSLAFGVPDIVNDVINAGIRDIDYFTGGGLSGGSYDPYQLPGASQSAANQAAEITGADIVPREAVPPSTQRAGDWIEAGVGMLPIGAGALVPAVKGGPAFGILAGLDRKGLKKLASRSINIYDPPTKPAREFALDYPSGAKADATGRLLEDIDGRPLNAERIAGRRMVGGEDVPLSSEDVARVAEATTGRIPEAVASRELGKDSGRYLVEREKRSGEVVKRAIFYHKGLPPKTKERVLSHELSHAIDEIAGSIPTSGLDKELRKIYNDLNNPQNHGKLFGPENNKYKGEDVQKELVAEAIRAYSKDPNYIKTVAPRVAARIREYANPNPNLNKHIQFNSLAAALAPVGLVGYLASQQGEQ